MPQFSIVINNESCKNTEIVPEQKVNNVKKHILTYIYNVQHAPAEEHQLDQVEFFFTDLHRSDHISL